MAVTVIFYNPSYVDAAPPVQQSAKKSITAATVAGQPKSVAPAAQLYKAQTLAQGILKAAYKNIFSISVPEHLLGSSASQNTERTKRAVEIPNKLLSLELAKLLTEIDRINSALGAEEPLPTASSSPLTASGSDSPNQGASPTIDNLVAKLHTVPAGGPDGPALEDLNKFPWPISGDIFSTPGSAFREGGAKWQGILIKAEPGAKVQSIAAGKVVYVGEMKNLGLLIMIDHGDGHISLYGRNSKILVSQDQQVTQHQTISTVNATATNGDIGLYFEIRRNGQPIDPRLICSNATQTK